MRPGMPLSVFRQLGYWTFGYYKSHKAFYSFPVWWYREPSIIDTFMESYDFSGKTVVPFCTSGSSGLGSTSSNLHALAKDARVIEGKRLSIMTTEGSLKKWVEEII